VLFECAWFEPRGVRRTARRHGLHTESSHRFERGVDPGDVADVLAHAGSLSTRLSDAAAVPGDLHVRRDPITAPRVALRLRRLHALLGTEVPLEQARTILENLGFEVSHVHEGSDHILQTIVPTWRPDVSREADLIEEVARVRGLDAIPTTLPAIRPQPPRDNLELESRVRAAAVALGLAEAVTYGFVSPAVLQKVGAPEATVKLLNPLNDERTVMRTSLVPGLLETVARARRHGERSARLFTLGAVFLQGAEGAELPDERKSFAAILVGNRPVHLGRPEEVDVYDAKGVATELVERITRSGQVAVLPFAPDPVPMLLHPRAAGRLQANGVPVGRFGMLHPDVVEPWELGPASAIIELDLGALRAAQATVPRYRPIPRLPAASRDIALVVHEDASAGEVQRVILEAAGELCESVELFDLFRGKDIPTDHRSLAFHVVYRDPLAASEPERARTLTDEEVDRTHAQVVKTARERLGARLR
jgi:phenylalanyl-tRNA synthetase beta chain